MAGKKIWVTAGIAAFIYGIYHFTILKKSVEFLQYSLSGLKFRIKGLQPEIIFSIQIFNPNTISVPVKEFFGVIKKDDAILADFRNVEPIELGAKETKVIDVSAKIHALTIIMQIIRGQKFNSVHIDAMLKTGMFDMPIQKDLSLSSLAGVGEIGRLQNQWNQLRPKRYITNGFQKGFLQYMPHKFHRLHPIQMRGTAI